MSTENILNIVPTKTAVYVVFRVHGGEGQRTYEYNLSDGLAIIGGADPAQFSGERVDGVPSGSASDFAGSIAEAIPDITELLGGAALL
jgi:hypothetical protein